jgi:type IV pilus assembly protein PilP
VRRGIFAVVLALAACGGDDAKDRAAPAPRPPPPPSAAQAQASARAQPAAPPDATKEALLAEVRKRQLTNDDFAESDTNRDPFRSYLAKFGPERPPIGKQHKVLLEKFSLDELRLVAIVAGDDVTPRAMFVDPSGMGVLIKRGDHVSKADANVARIAPDRVFFQIEEDAGGGKTKMVERVIELHAGELPAQ